MSDSQRRLELLKDPEFKALCRSKSRVSLTLTALTLLIYFGFISLIAFNKDFFKRMITVNIPVGIPIGIGVIIASWVLTGIYVRWANVRYDALVQNVKSKAADGNDADRHRTT